MGRVGFASIAVLSVSAALGGCGLDLPDILNAGSPPAEAPRQEAARVAPVDPRTLVGLDPQAVTRKLGTPENTRTSPPSAVWRYRAEGCTLDIFFYPDVDTRVLHALTYDVQVDGRKKDRRAVSECVGRIRAKGSRRG